MNIINQVKHSFTTKEAAKIAHVIDLVSYLIKMVSEILEQLYESIEELPTAFPIAKAVKAINDAFDSFKCFVSIAVNLVLLREVCEKEYSEFFNLHSALLYYNYDAVMLLRHSLLSAFTSYYSTAYSELRAAMESIIRGTIFDLLALPKYRKNAKELNKIKGYGNAKGFPELLSTLDKELGDSRPKLSAAIFDIIDDKLKDFNPKSAFTKLITQLKTWEIIKGKEIGEILSYYEDLSKYSHRPHPKFSEVGIRVIADKDWLSLEPVPKELITYLAKFTGINGWFTYLTLKVYSIDLANPKYLKCINWEAIKEIIPDIEELTKIYKSWQKVKDIIDEIKMAYNSINKT